MSSFPKDAQQSRIGFCSAPWTDCITYADGALKACDRNVASFGDWQKLGLKNAWESEAFQEFRKAMREGRYPDQDCASCHNNGTQRTAVSSLIGAYSIHYNYLKEFFGRGDIPALAALHRALELKTRSDYSDRILPPYFAYLGKLQAEHKKEFETNHEFHKAVVKLRVVGEALEDYLHGVLKPRRVATFRQSQLQAKCTARCVMCAGKFTGEIVDGPTMDEKFTDEAFAEIEDVTDFWCNGAEYLFYPGWKKIAEMLHKEGVPLRVSTNGILLTEQNIDFMLDKRMLSFLTVSLDGATKETMEAIRVRANFDKNMQRIRYVLKKATDMGHYFEFTAAFVMMKRNLHELPRFVRLMKEQMPPQCLPLVTVLCQPLENFNMESYRRFVHTEHHALVGEQELRRIFQEVYQAHLETGVQVTFYNQKIKDFMAEGMPFPKFFAREMDVEIIQKDLTSTKHRFDGIDELVEKEFQSIAEKFGYRMPEIRAYFFDFIKSKLAGNVVVTDTMEVFPELKKGIDAMVNEHLDLLFARLETETVGFSAFGISTQALKYRFRAPVVGDYLFNMVAGKPALAVQISGKLALLHDGKIVPLDGGTHFVLNAKDDKTGMLLKKPDPREAKGTFAGSVYLHVHALKDKLIGGRKSLLLWKLSVAYRKILSLCGVEAKLLLDKPRA